MTEPMGRDAYNTVQLTDPYPLYALLREDKPVHTLADQPHRFLLFRYDECHEVLRNGALFKSDLSTTLVEDDRMVTKWERLVRLNAMPFIDPPDHTRIRKAVSSPFTPRNIKSLADRAAVLSGELLDKAAGKDSVDLIGDFGFPFALAMIADLMGIPAGDAGNLRRWADAVALLLDTSMPLDQQDEPRRLVGEFIDYLETDLVPTAKATPGSFLGEVFNTGLLTDEEQVGACLSLLAAGFETTMNAIGNGAFVLAAHPEQRQAIVEEPDLIPQAVEEILRYVVPLQLALRVASEDTEICGVPIKANEEVIAVNASANRDPRMFEDSETFDIFREQVPHLAFGFGHHHCIGAALARLEINSAFRVLLERSPHYEVTEAPILRPSRIVRGFEALHVSMGSA